MNTFPAPEVPVFCAIDVADLDRAVMLARAVRTAGIGLKFGMEFVNAFGPAGVRRVADEADAPFFLDLKFHDIPNTVAGAVRAVSALRPFVLNVHAAGGVAMMRAAAEAAAGAAETSGAPRTLVIAVTVLTSLDDDDLAAVGLAGTAQEATVRLARLAQQAGLDGVVCSPLDIAAVREACGPDFRLMTPGVRPAGSALGDQKRVMSPGEATAAGADWLVVGRPITEAEDPGAAAAAIAGEIAAAARP